MWPSQIGAIVKAEIGNAEWQVFSDKADSLYGQVGNLQKNVLHIGALLSFAWDAGKRSPSLEKLCAGILDPSNVMPALCVD